LHSQWSAALPLILRTWAICLLWTLQPLFLLLILATKSLLHLLWSPLRQPQTAPLHLLHCLLLLVAEKHSPVSISHRSLLHPLLQTTLPLLLCLLNCLLPRQPPS
jgi:hypothetical protein